MSNVGFKCCRSINDATLVQIVPLIARFNDLEELNLQNNLFTELPSDLSAWDTINNLNLSNNNLLDFESVVAALASMPSLQSLYINLFEEAQVDLVMRELKHLQFLNGLAVDRDVLN